MREKYRGGFSVPLDFTFKEQIMKAISIKLNEEEMLTANEVKDLISTNDVAVMKAAILLYNKQLPSEQKGYVSLENNKCGFSRFDAPRLTAFAKHCIERKGCDKKTINQMRFVLLKYSSQIANIENDKRDIQYKWRIN